MQTVSWAVMVIKPLHGLLGPFHGMVAGFQKSKSQDNYIETALSFMSSLGSHGVTLCCRHKSVCPYSKEGNTDTYLLMGEMAKQWSNYTLALLLLYFKCYSPLALIHNLSPIPNSETNSNREDVQVPIQAGQQLYDESVLQAYRNNDVQRTPLLEVRSSKI